jgi:hypothetical protein
MTGPEGSAPGLDPCAEERRIADERCALADRLGEAAQAAADRTKEAQRVYDEHVGRSERAAAVADPRAVRTAKEAAWTDFRRGNTQALSREAVEAAARDWLQEIDRIGRTANEAEQEVAREHDAATTMVAELERLAHEADVARLNAESATTACAAAREALAACEVAERDRIAGKARAAAEEAESTAARPRLYGGVDPEPAGRTLEEETPDRLIGDHEPAILKLLRGDREAMDRTVTAMAGAAPAERRHWQLMVSGLIDAILARAIEASALEFPTEQPFWALFSEDQARDIATALASFGYRFDGMGGFVDGRVPSQRDLSLAVGYAGFDPMRIRRWPTEAEAADLYRGVAVAAGDYLAGAAGGLTLGEMIDLLGGRAEALTDLWNDWSRIRTLLLEP